MAMQSDRGSDAFRDEGVDWGLGLAKGGERQGDGPPRDRFYGLMVQDASSDTGSGLVAGAGRAPKLWMGGCGRGSVDFNVEAWLCRCVAPSVLEIGDDDKTGSCQCSCLHCLHGPHGVCCAVICWCISAAQPKHALISPYREGVIGVLTVLCPRITELWQERRRQVALRDLQQ